MIVRNLAETSKRRIHTGYAASVVGCIFNSFGLRYPLRKPAEDLSSCDLGILA
jgi:hypothetical protein